MSIPVLMQFKKTLIIVTLAGAGSVGAILYHTTRQLEGESRSVNTPITGRGSGHASYQSLDVSNSQIYPVVSSETSFQSSSSPFASVQEHPSSKDVVSLKPALSEDRASSPRSATLPPRIFPLNATQPSPSSGSMVAGGDSTAVGSAVPYGLSPLSLQQPVSSANSSQPVPLVSPAISQQAAPNMLPAGQSSTANSAYNSIPSSMPSGSPGSTYNVAAPAGVMYRSDTDPVLLNHERAVLLKGQDAVNFNTPEQDLQVIQSANGSQPQPVSHTPVTP